jgi:hypothetical protein
MKKVGAHVQDRGGTSSQPPEQNTHAHGYAGQGNWKEDFLPKA